MRKLVPIVCLVLIGLPLVSFRQTDSWLGTWTGEHPDGVTYSLQVADQYRGMNLCELRAEGIQTFYRLECWATGTSGLLKVYYRSTKEGAFYAKDRVKINDPLLILKREKGKVIWQWQQVFDGKLVMRKK
ncbi:hypothetical protein G8759_19670 [Spirosoma aureum]|uniref:DUF2147 domain-containing protein n=1 Tax=Spirosoma aureum TaxID=2692134 RepID=A0A6G9AQA2_9BACT|nr:DUF5991 domain-containing protein [Spirosoma aureum]QIP14672.1 hypothetical protein G8759_19670 [Spirosoma aureum]